MKTKILSLALICLLVFGCKDNSNLQPSLLYYSYDYATHSAVVIKTPNDYPEGSIGLGYSDYSGDIIIPSSVVYNGERYEVVGIGMGAFAGCKDLRSIKIPSSITNIEKYAIMGCPNLDAIVIDSKNPKFDSRNNCNAVIETETNILLFGSNKAYVPSNVIKIGSYSFVGLSFESLEIQEGVNEIEHHTLQNLSNLTTITLPNSLITIGEDALSNCISLKSVTIGRNVKQIVDAFLAGDNSLETITCLAITPPQWVLAHVDIPQNVILYVPDNSVSSYTNDEVWGKYFMDNIRPISTKY